MALTEGHPTGLPALRWLVCEDERGSAAVEFIVLIPVYVLMLMGTLALAQMSLARQSVVLASRLIVWSPDGRFADDDVKTHLFGAHDGTLTVTPQPGDNAEVIFQASEFRPTTVDLGGEGNRDEAGIAGNDGSSGRIQQIAAALFNNKLPLGSSGMSEGAPTGDQGKLVYGNDRAPLKRRKLRVSFQNTGLTFGLVPTSSVDCEVLVWNHDHLRGEHNGDTNKQFSQYHWVGHPAAHGGRWRENDPGVLKNRYLSPQRGTFANSATPPRLNVFSSSGGAPGVWDRFARIGGGVREERSFYAPRVRGP